MWKPLGVIAAIGLIAGSAVPLQASPSHRHRHHPAPSREIPYAPASPSQPEPAVFAPPMIPIPPPSRPGGQQLTTAQLSQTVASPAPLAAEQACAAGGDCSASVGELVVQPPPMRGFEAFAGRQQAMIEARQQMLHGEQAVLAMQQLRIHTP